MLLQDLLFNKTIFAVAGVQLLMGDSGCWTSGETNQTDVMHTDDHVT